MRYVLTALVGVLLFSGLGRGAEILEMKSEPEKINYSVGYQIGQDFKDQGVALDAPALVHGIRDALRGNKPQLSEEEMRRTLISLKQKILALETERKKARAEKLRAEGRAFLAANGKKTGVVTLASGLQYRVLQRGRGKLPTPQDTVTVRYHGASLEGGSFDGAGGEQGPVTIPMAKVIPGWREALQQMQEGAKWRLFIPPDLAFGRKGPLADRTVIYDLELLSVHPPADEASRVSPGK